MENWSKISGVERRLTQDESDYQLRSQILHAGFSELGIASWKTC